MSKIHSHYDNLKVSRMAPPEVIRAAYKALSQKYHPDKNPGDEKAARIMAILNSAYSILSDPQRRKEHDEWIAAEEWEIEWLESTKSEEDTRTRDDFNPQWVNGNEKTPHYRRRTDPQWWLMLLLCLALGWGAAVLMQIQFNFMSLVQAGSNTLPVQPLATPMPAASPQPVDIKFALNTRLPLIGSDSPCDLPSRAETAPNGENWPAKSGYIDGYKVGNVGNEIKLLLDNSANRTDSFVQVLDREKHLAIRHIFVKAQEKLLIDSLLAGNYEVQQQVLGLSNNATNSCEPSKGSESQSENANKPNSSATASSAISSPAKEIGSNSDVAP